MTNFNGTVCVCGCGQRAAQLHHVVYQQELRRLAHAVLRIPTLVDDDRNLVPVAFDCHGAHHGRSRPLSLHMLPSDAFVFAAEVLGRERAYEYLRRRYEGEDLRLERLLEDVAA